MRGCRVVAIAEASRVTAAHAQRDTRGAEGRRDAIAQRLGQRAQAVWKPAQESDYGMDNILYYKPLDEPDVPVEKIGQVPVSGWEG